MSGLRLFAPVRPGPWGSLIVSQQPPPPGWVPPVPPPLTGPVPGPGSTPPGYGPPPPAAPGGGYGAHRPPYVGYGPPVHKPGVVALRPLTLGDLYDGAFKTIRRNPQAMVGLAALVTTVFMVVPAVLTLVLAALGELSPGLSADASSDTFSAVDSGAASVVANLGAVFGLFATVVLNGMLVHVVAEAVLGRRTTIGAAWAATRGRLWRLVGLMLLSLLVLVLLLAVPVVTGILVGLRAGLVAGLVTGVPLLVLAFAAALLLQAKYLQLAAPALVLERVGVFAALRRAGRLSRGQVWRILGVLLLTVLVAGLVGQVVAVPLAGIGAVGPFVMPGTGGALVLVFASYLSQIVVGAVTTPFTSAVAALQYVDQRIRKEGLDVELIAASQQPPSGAR